MSDGIDVDSVLAGIESPSSGVPMTSEPVSSEPPPQEAKTTSQEFEINWNGKQIKAPLDKLTKWASQGYDYAQRMEAFKNQQTEFENTRQQFEPKLKQYSEVDEYASKNPEWWDHVTKSWQERQQALDPSNPIAGELQSVKQELQELKKFREQLTHEKSAEAQRVDDERLDSEISQLREQHKDLDWNSVDETGFTLESRILKHATENGINSFRAAFRDYNHDRLVEMASLKAKEDAVKERQKSEKAGLLGYSKTPRSGIQGAADVKGKTYSQLAQEALQELGL
jgi:hypothetical protein